jgi:hypothetical protein
MVCLLAGTRFTKSLVLFGGWQAACRLDCYKIQQNTNRSIPERGSKGTEDTVRHCNINQGVVVLCTPRNILSCTAHIMVLLCTACTRVLSCTAAMNQEGFLILASPLAHLS